MEFSNNLIQEQSIWEVLPLILSKRTFKQRAWSEKECHQSKEIEQLWTKCCDPCSVISLAAVEVLLQLVAQNVVEYSYVMHGFLAQITSTRHLLGPIHGVTKLLCLQITKNTDFVSYSLSSNSHPYITILANCPESWSMLLQEIDNLFQTTHNSSISSLLHIFKAFFQHVFYNPKPDYAACKSLYTLLLEKASELSNQTDTAVLDKILSLITNHIRLYKTNMTSLGHGVSLCQQTLRWLLKNGDGKLDQHMQTIIFLLIEMMLEQLALGMSMMSPLVLLRKITEIKPWIAVANGSVFLISHLLLQCSEYYLGELVPIASNLANHILSNSDNNKRKLSFLVLPLLQILSSKRHAEKTATFSLASQLLSNIESILQDGDSNYQTENKAETCSLGARLKKASISEKMFQLITTSDESTLLNWLKSVELSLSTSEADKKDLSLISLFLSSFLLTCSDCAALHVLAAITAICRADPTQAPYFFPLMLYKMERCSSPEMKLHVLQTVPKLATHKICVKQVLGILLVLNNNSELKAITLRLMFRLWMAQPRVFSQLHKLLLEKTRSISSEALAEFHLAKAVTIRDICRERPSQHGEDLVGLISTTIDENAHRDTKTNAVLVCLALESLQALVAAEVLNLPSTWEVLKAKIEYHTHPLVMGAVCDLFSLVPSLADDSKEYEDFKEYALSFLWRYSEHENESVNDAAYKALAKFDRNDFLVRHLPKQIRKKIIQHLQSTPKIKKIMEESLEKDEKIDLEAFPIPGYYYIELLHTRIPVTYNEGIEEFLKSIVAQEISGLPRGLAHSVLKTAETSENKLMSSIPELMKKHYDKCKQPALKCFIAASLLYCYELHVEKRSGKPIRSQAVTNIKLYRQLINQLVQEVPINSSDWHFNTDISQAWTAFMSRVFKSYVEGRKMELALQKEREHMSEDECNAGMQNAWLWTRDTLTDLLKTASKGTHIMQGNSVLALAGLAAAVYTYQISSENNTVASQVASDTRKDYATTEAWIVCVTDTMLVILDGNLHTHGALSPMTWCQQVSSTSSSPLARACAAISLAQVIPALLGTEFERLEQVLHVLQVRIPGQAKQGNSAVIQNHCSVGLGLVLQKLHQENIGDSLGQEGDLLFAKTLDALKNAALSGQLQNTEGAIFGLGLSVSSISKETESSIKTRAQSAHSKLVQFFESLVNSEDSQKLQVLGTALAHSTAALFAAEILESESLVKIAQLLKRLVETFSQNVVLASAFGMFLYNLKSSGLAEVCEMFPYWASHWRSGIANTSLPPSSRVAAVSGLSALLGSTQINQTADNSPSSKQSCEDGVKMLKQLLGSHDMNFTGNVYWNISKLCFAHKKLLDNQSNVPNTLEYLGEDSVLNCLVRVLIQLGKREATQEWGEMLNIVLRVLTNGPKERFPPLNWNIIVSPLIKKYTGASTIGHFLDFALCSPSSPATGSFLPSWLTSSIVLNLTVECKVRLYSSLRQLVGILSAKKLRDILEFGMKYFLQDEVDIKLAEAILDGLYSLLKMSEPPQSVFPYIKDAIEKIYRCFPSNLELLIPKLAACIEFLTSEEVEILTEPKEGSQLKSLMMRREIILKNPLLSSKLLKPFIDLTMSPNIKSDTLAALISTIFCMKVTSIDSIVREWIIQLLAQLGSTENHTETVSSILLVLTVISLAVCRKENDILTTVLSLQDGHTSQDHQMWFSSIRDLFPPSLAAVLTQPQWKTRIEKIIDKLMVIWKSSRNTESSRLILDCLLELRNLEVFEKRSVWTQVVSFM